MFSASTFRTRCCNGRGQCPEVYTGRFRACRRHRLSVRPRNFDLLASRFGVMFFADPALSFANMRKALRSSGRLAFACWREPRENPWLMTPLQAPTSTFRSCRSKDRKILAVLVCLRSARPSHPRRSRLYRYRDGAAQPLARYRDRARSRCGGAGALQIGPAGRALEGQPPEWLPPPPVDPRSTGAFCQGRHGAACRTIWIVTARA